MARNEEKAQSMLNRWVDMKSEEKRKPKERRPYLASECRDLADAHKWRSEILREIGIKVSEIQNEGLGEHRLRDLNDEINKLLRERVHWERRIVDLGGPNYTKHAAKMTDLDGNIIDVPNPSGRGPGYRYFGAAKKLPGVRELFEKPPEVKRRRTRYEIYKRIDASYYGYRDDEDGILEKLEATSQEEMRHQLIQEFERIKAIQSEAMRMVKSGEVASVEPTDASVAVSLLMEEVEDVVEEERKEREREELEKNKQQEFVVHVPLPDDKEIERMVVENKKKELLSKYMSEELMQEEKEAKEMLNVKRPTGVE
ncbi:pre-mRNA-splicing factor ISY1 homolog isoform X1 [Zingiber officinale]|nr:pre-mRNA-splicing factor ISY1 homolog [Zingiber officinale]XP_042429453.1 pre-mRNA-splicing factor ISY1 homolog isoform X1 [Zingiber officinale]